MKENKHKIKDILNTVFKENNNTISKKLIYNNALFGGIASKWIILALVLLPLIMYAAIFNSYIFNLLGIAQAIVFYIILLVVAMQIIIAAAYFNNKKVINNAQKSWENYFPTIDFKMILSSGVTPYVDFKKHYEIALHDDLENDALEQRLAEAFTQMEEENSGMVEAMRKDKAKNKGK